MDVSTQEAEEKRKQLLGLTVSISLQSNHVISSERTSDQTKSISGKGMDSKISPKLTLLEFTGSSRWCRVVRRRNGIMFTARLVRCGQSMLSHHFLLCSLLSFALIACEQNHYTRPELTPDNRIEIIQGK